MSRVLNLLGIHQETNLSGLGMQGEGHLAVVHFHLNTQWEINTKCLWLITDSPQIICFLVGVALFMVIRVEWMI